MPTPGYLWLYMYKITAFVWTARMLRQIMSASASKSRVYRPDECLLGMAYGYVF
jgi:hypothetical protein